MTWAGRSRSRSLARPVSARTSRTSPSGNVLAITPRLIWSLTRMPAGRPARVRAIVAAHPRASASMAQLCPYVNGIASKAHYGKRGGGGVRAAGTISTAFSNVTSPSPYGSRRAVRIGQQATRGGERHRGRERGGARTSSERPRRLLAGLPLGAARPSRLRARHRVPRGLQELTVASISCSPPKGRRGPALALDQVQDYGTRTLQNWPRERSRSQTTCASALVANAPASTV